MAKPKLNDGIPDPRLIFLIAIYSGVENSLASA